MANAPLREGSGANADDDPHARGTAKLRALGENGRRVLENGRAEERRRHPYECERGNGRVINRKSGAAENGRRLRALVFAGLDDRDGAFVMRLGGVGVEVFVEAWRGGEREGEEKRGERAKSHSDMARLHLDGDAPLRHGRECRMFVSRVQTLVWRRARGLG